MAVQHGALQPRKVLCRNDDGQYGKNRRRAFEPGASPLAIHAAAWVLLYPRMLLTESPRNAVAHTPGVRAQALLPDFRQRLAALAERHGERLLHTPNNQISMAVTLAQPSGTGRYTAQPARLARSCASSLLSAGRRRSWGQTCGCALCPACAWWRRACWR